MTKHIGTIIDSSYFQSYELIDEHYHNIHSYKICKVCLKPIDRGFMRDDKSGFAGTLPHICDEFKEFLPKGVEVSMFMKRFIPELEWGQFIFIPPVRIK